MREKKSEKTTRQCRQLEKRRNSWSMSDIIVVGVSGMEKLKGWGGKKGGCEQTHAEKSRRWHMHHDSDDDTIWSFAPEACDNITATCYVPHGRRHAWELLMPTRRTQPPTRVGRQHLHTCQGEGVVWGTHIGRLRKRKAAYLEVADRRVLGRIFCIWICRICQIFLRRCLPTFPSFLLQIATSTRDRLFSPDSLCLSFVRSPEVHAEHF